MATPGPAPRVLTRPATVEDADAIGAVHVRAWQVGYRGQLPDAYLDGLSIDARQAGWRRGLAEVPSDRPVLVAEDPSDGHVCGWTSVGPLRPDGCADLDAATTGELWALNLEPEAWGRGIATALMAAAVAQLQAAGHDEAILWVLVTNARARRFYEREGWAADGATKVDVHDGIELREVRYRRRLRPPGPE